MFEWLTTAQLFFAIFFFILTKVSIQKFYKSYWTNAEANTTNTGTHPQSSRRVFYNLDLRLPMSFSNFIAFCKSPDIFNFPLMNAVAAFNFPGS